MMETKLPIQRKRSQPLPKWLRDVRVKGERDSRSNPVRGFLAGQLSENTKRAYRNDFLQFLRWLNKPEVFSNPETMFNILARVDATTAAAYRDDLLHENSSATVARKMTVINGIYKAMRLEGWIKTNPFAWVKRPRVSNEGKTPAFSKQEAELLLSQPDPDTQMGMRDRILLLLLFYCGLRRSEVVHVRPCDFHQDRGHVVLTVRGKGGKEAILKIPPHVWRTIEEYLQEYDIHEEDYLFSGRSKNPRYNHHSRPISPQRVYYLVRNYSQMAGLDPKAFTVHSTRATSITLALDGGASLRQVQTLARHSDPKTTVRYDRNRNNLDDNAVDYIHLHDGKTGAA